MLNTSESDRLWMVAVYLEYRCMRFCVCSHPWNSRWCSRISEEATILVILVYTLLGYMYLWLFSLDPTRTLKKKKHPHTPHSFWLSDGLLFDQGTAHPRNDSSPDCRLPCRKVTHVSDNNQPGISKDSKRLICVSTYDTKPVVGKQQKI